MTYAKAIISGKHIELVQSEYPPLSRRHNTNGGRKPKDAAIPISEVAEADLRKRYRATSKNMQQLLECNFSESYAFLTLTFADTEALDIRSIDDCLAEFRKFKKRLDPKLKRKQDPFQYIGVIEFQDEDRNGAVHFHLVCNITKMHVTELKKIWGLGSIHCKYIKANATTNKKIVHYLEKGIRDFRLVNHDKFLRSQKLKKPTVIKNLNVPQFQEALHIDQAEYLDGYTAEKTALGVLKAEEYYVDMPKEVLKFENFQQYS
ncbi:rolling circle replication-associated protein [Peribacillus loiseleuriae]|uniref:rolling circle replication-associated protein n=1 Tax=Peribacillus loiseleuriae TaxID=1679170 RepID=UPI003CFCCD1F